MIAVRGRPEHRAEARAGARLQPLAHLLRDRHVGRLVVLAVGQRQRADVERIALAVLADQRADDAVAAAAFVGREIRHAAERRAERRGDRRHVVAQPVRDRLGGRAAQGRGRRDRDAPVVASSSRRRASPHRRCRSRSRRSPAAAISTAAMSAVSRIWQAEGGGGSVGALGVGMAGRSGGSGMIGGRPRCSGAGAAAERFCAAASAREREQRGDEQRGTRAMERGEKRQSGCVRRGRVLIAMQANPSNFEGAMPIRAILFDKDGTLVDIQLTLGPATCDVLRQLSGGDRRCSCGLPNSRRRMTRRRGG